MSAPETPFTDHSAVVRGLQVIQREAPLFAAHIEQERERLLSRVDSLIEAGHLNTATALKKVAHDL